MLTHWATAVHDIRLLGEERSEWARHALVLRPLVLCDLQLVLERGQRLPGWPEHLGVVGGRAVLPLLGSGELSAVPAQELRLQRRPRRPQLWVYTLGDLNVRRAGQLLLQRFREKGEISAQALNLLKKDRYRPILGIRSICGLWIRNQNQISFNGLAIRICQKVINI